MEEAVNPITRWDHRDSLKMFAVPISNSLSSGRAWRGGVGTGCEGMKRAQGWRRGNPVQVVPYAFIIRGQKSVTSYTFFVMMCEPLGKGGSSMFFCTLHFEAVTSSCHSHLHGQHNFNK